MKNNMPCYKYDEILLEKNEKNILDDWNYKGTEQLEKSIIDKWGGESNKEWADILNKIALWKVDRQLFIDEELIQDIVNIKNADWNANSFCEDVEIIVERMLNCDGIGLPMASTILHFLHPDDFLIIDKRAYRVIYNKELKLTSNDKENAKCYIEYMKQCRKYYEDCGLESKGIEFKYLDRYTYQLDIERGNKVNY